MGAVAVTVRFCVLPLVGLMLVAGCSNATSSPAGTLSGHLYEVGGPAPGLARGILGTVVATGPGGPHTVKVGADGVYTMHLPPGAYTVTGSSPMINEGRQPCSALGQVAVVQNTVHTADVICGIN